MNVGKIRILVVDDEPMICKAFDQFFSEVGYTVRTAQDKDSGIELFRKFSPHFVFLDVIFPNDSGIEILRRMMEIDKTAQVIMTSGMHDVGVAKRAIALGAIDYVTKPIEMKQLNQFLKIRIRKMFR